MSGDHMKQVYSLNATECTANTVISASPELQSIMLKLKNMWTCRQTASMDGTVYNHKSSATITLARLSIGATQRGFMFIVPASLRDDLVTTCSSVFAGVPAIMSIYAGEPTSRQTQEARLILKLLKTESIL
jgi:hypothetical protein